MQFIAANAQDTKVEIYDVSSNSIITGFVTDSIGDSIYVQTDKSELIAFAKVDMQGLNYGVSKEIKKLQRELILNETRHSHLGYPGKYQMQNGKIKKGRIMYLLTTIGIVCLEVGVIGIAISSPILIYAVVGYSGALINLAGVTFIGSLYAFMGGMITVSGGGMWYIIDRIVEVELKVRNRYYYTGESSSSNRFYLT